MNKNCLLIFCWVFSVLPGGFSQNVGIGTSTPTRAKLEISGAVGATSAIIGSDGSGLSLQRSFPGIGFNQYYDGANSRYIASGFAGVTWFNTTNGWWAFDVFSTGSANNIAASSARAITIGPGGKVGIAGGPPNALLQLPNTIDNRKIVLYEGANNNNQFYGFGIENSGLRYNVDAPSAAHKFYAANNAFSSTFLMSIGGNKKVMIGGQAQGFRLGINSADPTYTLEVVETANRGLILVNPLNGYHNWELRCDTYSTNASDALTFYYDQSNTPKGWFRPTDGGYTSNSDRRLKKDIFSMGMVLSKVLQLQPSSYYYKEDAMKRSCIGLVAQDVKNLFPELVDVRFTNNTEMPDIHGISYSGLGVIAVKAIQEQQAIIADQQKQIDVLKRAVDELKTLLNR